MLHYILQVVIFQCAFLLAYDLLLRHQTFFNWNRTYLLTTSVLSLVIPFMQLDVLSNYTTAYGSIQLPEVVLGEVATLSSMSQSTIETVGIAVQRPSTPTWRFVLLGGAIIFGIWFLFKCLRLITLRVMNPYRWSNNVIVVSLKDSLQAFSFFNTIFLGSRIKENEKGLILKHEMVHVNQKHSLDIIWFQLLRIAFWFNPCVYWYQNRITDLHEFIADREVLGQENRSDFYQSLLSQVFQVSAIPLTNTFWSKSLVKKRITMIGRRPSNNSALWRYVLVFPLALSMLVYVACEKEVELNDRFTTSDLEQFTKTIDFDYANNETSMYNQVYFDKIQNFLRENPGHVVWIDNDFVNNKMTYSVHSKDELPDYRYFKTEVSLQDGFTYDLLMMHNLFEDEFTESEKIGKQYFVKQEEVPFAVIGQAPTFSHCGELSGEERKRCTSETISKFVNQNFNTALSSELGLVGRQRISVMFKIDKDGHVIDARARSPHPALDEEAIRVISLLPQFIPGEHQGEKVVASYSLPILFQVQ